jgi:NTP pyrophosphatase (non-canonical NTP hydrolase)
MKLEKLITKTISWHVDRNLIEGSTDKQQFMKLHEEVGELCESIGNGTDIRDDVGDIMVVLINMATRNGYTLAECLEVAYNDIKDRKGKMVEGVFVKDAA